MNMKKIIKYMFIIIISIAMFYMSSCYKKNFDVNSVNFNDATFEYDGIEHEIIIDGELPEYVSVVYIDNKMIDAGTKTATATFYIDGEEVGIKTAKLTINKIDYDMSGVEFKDATYTFDGLEHKLLISGDLPSGVTVEYTSNTLKDVGSIEVVASFKGDSNHKDIESMKANLSITKASYDMSNISFNDATYTYDGLEHELLISGDLPVGVSVSYSNNKLTDTGELEVVAIFTGDDNHEIITSKTARLTITKAIYDMSSISFNDATYTYDGLEHELLISGDLPVGVSVSYSNNKLTDASELEVVATFTGDDNHEDIAPMNAKLIINKAVYDMSSISFNDATYTYDGLEHELLISGDLPVGVSVSYSNNKLTDASELEVVATFTGDDNHEDIASMKAKLIINKAEFTLENITYDDKTIVYDGIERELLITGTLPDEISVRYINNKLKEAGTIEASAIFSLNNNYEEIELKATLTILSRDTYPEKHSVSFYNASTYEIYDYINYDLFPSVEKKQGYTFKGWIDSNENIYTTETLVTSDVTLYPYYVYNIVFIGDSIGCGGGWCTYSSEWPSNYWTYDLYSKDWGENGKGLSGGFARLFAEDNKNCMIYNYSFHGACAALEVNDNNLIGQYNSVKNDLDISSIGLFVVMASFNDLDYYMQTKYNYNLDKTISGLDYTLSTILSENPNASVLLMNSPDGRYIGHTSGDAVTYENACIALANKYNIPFTSLRTQSGIIESGLDWSYLFVDGIHPSEYTYKNLIYPTLKTYINSNCNHFSHSHAYQLINSITDEYNVNHNVYYCSTCNTYKFLIDGTSGTDERVEVNDNKVKVIIISGQSNAAGNSNLEYFSSEDLEKYSHEYDNVYIRFKNLFNDCNMISTFTKVKSGQGERTTQLGPELGLAEILSQYPNEKFYIIKSTFGSAGLTYPRDGMDGLYYVNEDGSETGVAYALLIDWIDTSLKILTDQGLEPEIIAMCWMQGEQDSVSAERANKYSVCEKLLVANLRNRYASYSIDGGFYFIDAAINDGCWTYSEIVNNQKKLTSSSINRSIYIDTNYHGIECDKDLNADGLADLCHHDAYSELRLGHLFGLALVNHIILK